MSERNRTVQFLFTAIVAASIAQIGGCDPDVDFRAGQGTGAPDHPGKGGGPPGHGDDGGGDDGGSSDDPTHCTPEPLPMRELDVAIPGPDFTLEGTLTLPATDGCTDHPAVVLVHGSGPIDRDSVLPNYFPKAYVEISMFADIALGLGEAGYAVVRYDKRTCNSFAGCENDYPPVPKHVNMDDFLADANAALDWIAQRPGVDGQRLALVGHSQGARFAPIVLSIRDDVQASVMLAGGYWQVDEMVAWQVEQQAQALADLGYDDAFIQDYLATWIDAVGKLRALRAGTFKGNHILGSPKSFWLNWMFYVDFSRSFAYEADRPILAISGDYDTSVSPEETQLWDDLFATVPNDPGHEAAILPCLTHTLNCVTEPNWVEAGPEDVGTEVDAQLLGEVVEFLDASM